MGFMPSKKPSESTRATMRRFGVGWLGSSVYPRDGGSPRNPVSFTVRFSFHPSNSEKVSL
jgi:hypothetical protein